MNLWYDKIPELENYINKYELNSHQNAIISPQNIGRDNFDKIIKKLKNG
jgi:hypothetical protein